jgi:hypothetical protein
LFPSRAKFAKPRCPMDRVFPLGAKWLDFLEASFR